MPGLACFSVARVCSNERRAVPVRMEHVVRTEAEQAASTDKAAAKKTKEPAHKRPPGRPNGSTNTPTVASTLSPELQRIHTLVHDLLQLIAGWLSLTSLVGDGHVGNSAAFHMAQQGGLPLIAKFRLDAAVYEPYDGPYQGRGPRRNYGAKLDDAALPNRYLK